MTIKTFFTCIFALSASVATAQTAPDIQVYCLKQNEKFPAMVLLKVADQKMKIIEVPFSGLSTQERNSEVAYMTAYNTVKFLPNDGIIRASTNSVYTTSVVTDIAIYDTEELKLAVSTVVAKDTEAPSLLFASYLCRNKIRTFD